MGPAWNSIREMALHQMKVDDIYGESPLAMLRDFYPRNPPRRPCPLPEIELRFGRTPMGPVHISVDPALGDDEVVVCYFHHGRIATQFQRFRYNGETGMLEDIGGGNAREVWTAREVEARQRIVDEMLRKKMEQVMSHIINPPLIEVLKKLEPVEPVIAEPDVPEWMKELKHD